MPKITKKEKLIIEFEYISEHYTREYHTITMNSKLFQQKDIMELVDIIYES